MGNGAVVQLVPQRYPDEIVVMTDLVGAAGGFGAFILPNVLGGIKGLTGSFAGGFILISVGGLVCSALLAWLSQAWEQGFAGRGGIAAEST